MGNESRKDEKNEGKIERICQIREQLFGGFNRKMAQAIDYNENNLSMTCSGGRPVGMSLLEAIADNLPNINMNWLFTGIGEMELPNKSEDDVHGNAEEGEAIYYVSSEKIRFYEDEIARKNEVIDALREANNAYKVAMEIIKGGKQ